MAEHQEHPEHQEHQKHPEHQEHPRRPRHQDETRAAYDGFAELYASQFADRLETRPFARNMIRTFAELVRDTGNVRVADVGCGPGHLTAMLHELGLEAAGFDLSPAMIDRARRDRPGLPFEEARMEALPVEGGALGGVLAHYSMIHTPPGELPALLAEQARVLAPRGLLLISFFGTEGTEPVRFDHKVTPAYSWPVDRLAELVTGARVRHGRPAAPRPGLRTGLPRHPPAGPPRRVGRRRGPWDRCARPTAAPARHLRPPVICARPSSAAARHLRPPDSCARPTAAPARQLRRPQIRRPAPESQRRVNVAVRPVRGASRPHATGVGSSYRRPGEDPGADRRCVTGGGRGVAPHSGRCGA